MTQLNKFIDGAFTATGQSVSSAAKQGSMAVSVSGVWVGTIDLEWSFDGGSTFIQYASYTAPTNFVLDCPSGGIHWRFNCTAYTSGTIDYLLAG